LTSLQTTIYFGCIPLPSPTPLLSLGITIVIHTCCDSAESVVTGSPPVPSPTPEKAVELISIKKNL